MSKCGFSEFIIELLSNLIKIQKDSCFLNNLETYIDHRTQVSGYCIRGGRFMEALYRHTFLFKRLVRERQQGHKVHTCILSVQSTKEWTLEFEQGFFKLPFTVWIYHILWLVEIIWDTHNILSKETHERVKVARASYEKNTFLITLVKNFKHIIYFPFHLLT